MRLLTCRPRAQGQLNGISVPEVVWATPGHYSVVALLPEDHTYAKGSLFILAPGTKCVVFDMDGAHAGQPLKPCVHSLWDQRSWGPVRCPSPLPQDTSFLLRTRCVLGSPAICRDALLHRCAPVLIKTACSR